MFNLTVSEAHTYYVGQDGWLVHNQNKSSTFSSNWGTYNIDDSMKAIGADPTKYTLNTNGTKKLFVSADGTKQIVYDVKDGYYRVQDLTHPGAKVNAQTSYLDALGNRIPENVPVLQNGKWVQTGVSKDTRKGLTHFNNSGPCY